MKRLFAFFFCLLTFQGFAQDYKRTLNWYFGDSIGMSFSTNPPTLLSKGGLSKSEGSASISDSNGQLLFYTNGVTVWDKNNGVMLNGTGLNGHWSSTQGSVIVPQPDNDSLFYIFTTDAMGQAKGLQYSIVNMNANNGLGAVIVKNVLLQTPVCEKLAATKHQNGKDIWVVAHGFGSNTFFVYLITKQGLVNCPIISNSGSIHPSANGNNAQGQMKFSADGHKIAATVFDLNNSKVDLFDFDNLSGKLYNYIPISSVFLPFGVEFSENAHHIFITTIYNELLTYQINLSGLSEIENSRTVLADYPNAYWITTHLQLASNSKIYVTFPDSSHLGVINYPDSGHALSQYNAFDVSVNTQKTNYGLPNFLSSYFYRPTLDFVYASNCTSSIATLQGKASVPPSEWNWRVKRFLNGNIASYNTQNISYTFPDSGWYEVRLIANSDTVVKNIFIDAPILPLVDTLGCGMDSVVLKIPDSYRCIQWSDTAASLYNRIIKTNGTYTLQGYNSNGCLITDSIRVNFSPPATKPIITKINDSLQSSPASNYQWLLNDTLLAGAVTQSIKPMKAGLYKVIITDNNGCSNMSTAFSSNVGIKPISTGSIRIYPNPANDKLYIESDDKIAEVKIYDVTGRIVYEQSTISDSSLQIDCNKFIRGIYFIKINSNLNTYYSHKIVIQ